MARPRPIILGELRPSQIITTFGPGAVIDQPTASLVLAGTDYWSPGDDQVVDEPRLRASMGVGQLYRPRVVSDRGMRGIPAFPFPRYLVCPRCQRLASYEGFHFDRVLFRCPNRPEHKTDRAGRLPRAFPARFVIACPKGHLDDFPWSYYVHRGETTCDELALTFFERSESGGIGDLFVRCRDCKRSRSMEDAFAENAAKALGSCPGTRPWLQDHDEGCDEVPRTILRGASNLYFPIVRSALSIPEWDDPIHSAIAHHEADLERIDTLEKLQQALGLGVLSRLRDQDPDKIWDTIKRRRELEDTAPSPLDIRLEEFRALSQPVDPNKAYEQQFQTEFMRVPPAFDERIAHLVVVRRLREVRALDAFTRIDSPPDLLLEDDEALQHVQLQSLSRERLNWRPAIELLGEGVFIALHEEAVQAWEHTESVQARQMDLQRAYRKWRAEREMPEADFPGSRFILLHSLAHMLITTLALECGYSSTSIRERIYSGVEGDQRMAGVLLYTATPDSDGSLGGLADQGHSERFEYVLNLSLRRAGYCSSDPLCGHSAAGEMGQTNGAACHACLLVSETSCERSNHFLDRAHVVSTVAELGTEFFPQN